MNNLKDIQQECINLFKSLSREEQEKLIKILENLKGERK